MGVTEGATDGLWVGDGLGVTEGATDGLGDGEVLEVLDPEADLVGTPLIQTNFLPLFMQVNLFPL